MSCRSISSIPSERTSVNRMSHWPISRKPVFVLTRRPAGAVPSCREFPDEMQSLWWWVLAIALIVAGVAGTVVPVLPGAALVFAGMLLAAWIDDFQRVGWITLSILGA